ncbi:MAG: hypothetical protein CMN87_18240 [Stappia sp.]|nr:hypothetical protein [Stappia sp.]MBM21946.1 hypothetical protein [Stappia sp.]
MVNLVTRSPARADDCLECASPFRWIRKASLFMRAGGDSVAISLPDAAGGDLLAVAYLWPTAPGWREFCLTIRPAARPHMRALVRLAQLRLDAVAQTGLRVKAHVRPGHAPGERMARMVGFVPDRSAPGWWIHVWRL